MLKNERDESLLGQKDSKRAGKFKDKLLELLEFDAANLKAATSIPVWQLRYCDMGVPYHSGFTHALKVVKQPLESQVHVDRWK